MELLLLLTGLLLVQASQRDKNAGLPSTIGTFTPLPEGSGTMPPDTISSSVTFPSKETLGCSCRQRCIAHPKCRGYGINEAEESCKLTEQLPTQQKLQPTEESWNWYAHSVPRYLGEPCSTDVECKQTVPGSGCYSGDNVCKCLQPLESTIAGQCGMLHEFIELDGTGRLTGSRISERPASSSGECRAVCSTILNCVAFDFSSPSQSCTFYSEGVVSDTPSGRQEVSFIRRFPALDGKLPPAGFTFINGSYLRVSDKVAMEQGPLHCFQSGAILYPIASKEDLDVIVEAGLLESPNTELTVGNDDKENEDKWVTSDGRTPENIPWEIGEPNNWNNEDCAHATKSGLFDQDCKGEYKTLCKFIGENIALGHDQKADDSTENVAWTVDLEDTVQVTGVLLVTTVEHNQTIQNTEYRVSLSPTAWDRNNSARCVHVGQPGVPERYGRMFYCDVPVTGRYIRAIGGGGHSGDLGKIMLAVFGNRLNNRSLEKWNQWSIKQSAQILFEFERK